MFAYLSGTVAWIQPESVALDVHGTGYELACSGKTLSHLQQGESTVLFTYLHIREQEMSLFGFASSEEKTIFLQLLNVNGVGPRMALSILSCLSSSELVQAIQTQNGKTLTRASGVGTKLAERIVRELQDKVTPLPHAVDGANVQAQFAPSNTSGEVISALVNLGYKDVDAHQAVALAQGSIDADAGFDTLFRQSLKNLG